MMLAFCLMAPAHASMPYQALPQQAAVVRGVVREQTTHAGARPSTTYVIAVEEVLQGQAPAEITLRLPGAVWNGIRMQVDHIPLWQLGDDVVATWLPDAPAPPWAQFTVVGERLEPIREGAPTTVFALEEVLDARR